MSVVVALQVNKECELLSKRNFREDEQQCEMHYTVIDK